MLKTSQTNLEQTGKLPFLYPVIDTTASIKSKYHKSRFPSMDATISTKSFSKVLLTEEDFNNNISGSLMKPLYSSENFSKKKVRTSLAFNMKAEISPSYKFIKTEVDVDSTKKIGKIALISNETPKNDTKKRRFKKSLNLNLNLEELSYNKLQNSALSTNNFSYSQTLKSNCNKMPRYIVENRMKILLALQMKEPYLVLECESFLFS